MATEPRLCAHYLWIFYAVIALVVFSWLVFHPPILAIVLSWFHS